MIAAHLVRRAPFLGVWRMFSAFKLKPFGPLQALILRKMAEAMFAGCDIAITPAQIVDNIQDHMGHIRGGKPREIGASLLLVWVVLGGPLFLVVSAHTRQRWMAKRLQNSRVDIYQDMARLRGIIVAGYYGHWQGMSQADNADNPVFAKMGFVLPAARTRNIAAGERAVEHRAGHDLGHEVFVGHQALPARAEVIVIGSGAGGGVAAANLADYGHDVLVVERGSHYPSTRINHHEARMTGRLYHQGALQLSQDRDIVLFQGSGVGGSTLVNNGICLRIAEPGGTHPDAPDVLARWADLGAPVDAARLAASYAAVEGKMGVLRVGPTEGRSNGTHLLDGWAAFAATSGNPAYQNAPARWFRKNWGDPARDEGCVYCGYCNTGCAYGRRRGSAQTFLRHACAPLRPHPAHILADATVERILWGARNADGKRVARGVRLALWDGGTHDILASKGVVLAAGTMASSRILSASEVDGSGVGLSINMACPVIALMPEGMANPAWNEDQMTSYVDAGTFLIESHFQPPMSMATMVPGWFGEHFRRMHNFGRIVSAGVLVPVDRLGHVAGGSMALKLGVPELALLRRALATLTKVHFAAGAIEVWPALLRGGALHKGMSDADIDAFFAEAIIEPDDVTLSSSHPQGGNPMGVDAQMSVVDMACRVHGTANVLVTDASVFPSCIRVNAQLTTMAMAHYATGFADPF
jgi:choline dehydrogenase-like flavoprotein